MQAVRDALGQAMERLLHDLDAHVKMLGARACIYLSHFHYAGVRRSPSKVNCSIAMSCAYFGGF